MNQKVINALEKADRLGAHFYFRKNGCACAVGQLIRELPEEKRAKINLNILTTDSEVNIAGCVIQEPAMGVIRDLLEEEYEVDTGFLIAIQNANDKFTLDTDILFIDYDKARRDYIVNYVKEYMKNEAK